MLQIITWLWGKDKYGPADVAKLAAGLKRHMQESYRFIVIADDVVSVPGVNEVWPIHDLPLTKIKGCFARLRMFDPLWQARYGIDREDRIVCIDLDVVITGPLHPLFHRFEQFMILTGANHSNPCPYNGSLFLVRGGYRPDVWNDFSLDAAGKVPHYEFPDDQAWLAHKIPGVIGWEAGPRSGVYAFQKPSWPKGDDLPADARMVVFPGWRSPEKFRSLPWIKEHWRVD